MTARPPYSPPMNPVKLLSKISSLFLLVAMLASCTSYDSYRGRVSNTPTPADRDRYRETSMTIILGPAFGALSPFIAYGVNTAISSKDPTKVSVPKNAAETKYLQPVASAKNPTPTVSDQNGTSYLAQP